MNTDDRPTPPSPMRARAAVEDDGSDGWLAQLRDSKGFHLFLERGLWPLLTLLAGGAYSHLKHHETAKKVDHVEAEVSQEKTKTEAADVRTWQDLAAQANKLGAAIEAMDARLAAIEKTQKAQSAVIVAREKDFVVEGRPARRIDPGLVKAVRENAVKNASELAARVKRPAAVIKPLPLVPPAPAPAKAIVVPQAPPPDAAVAAVPTPAPQFPATNSGGAAGK